MRHVKVLLGRRLNAIQRQGIKLLIALENGRPWIEVVAVCEGQRIEPVAVFLE